MNKDPYDLTPVPQKDIFTYTDMTEEDFENLVDNLFDRHAKKIGDHWVNEDGLNYLTVFDFARDLRAVLAAANGPLQATTSKPLPVIPWSGSNLTEMEELLQKVQQLETENADISHAYGVTRDVVKGLCEELANLKAENAALREELQQSEDRFRNIPDEVWSKADLVEMTNKALEERDDAYKQNAALREKAERYRLVTLRQDADNTALCNKLAALENQTQWECSCGGTDCEGQKENAALRKLVQHWYKLVPENIRSSIEDAQKETKP